MPRRDGWGYQFIYQPGQTVGRYILVRYLPHAHGTWIARCIEHGRVATSYPKDLAEREGCCRDRVRVDHSGERVGAWTALRRVPGERGAYGYLAACDCGYKAEVFWAGLVHEARHHEDRPLSCHKCAAARRRANRKTRVCSGCGETDEAKFSKNLAKRCMACARAMVRNGACPAGCGRPVRYSQAGPRPPRVPCQCGDTTDPRTNQVGPEVSALDRAPQAAETVSASAVSSEPTASKDEKTA